MILLIRIEHFSANTIEIYCEMQQKKLRKKVRKLTLLKSRYFNIKTARKTQTELRNC